METKSERKNIRLWLYSAIVYAAFLLCFTCTVNVKASQMVKVLEEGKGVLQNGDLLEEKKQNRSSVYRLSSTYEEAKKAIIEGWESGSDSIDISQYGLTRDEVSDIYFETLNQNPRFFYIRSYYSYSNPSTGMVTRLIPTYWYEADERDIMIENYEAAAAEALSGVHENWSTFEKVLYVNDYLAVNCEYAVSILHDENLTQDEKRKKGIYSSYGVLVNKTAVCNGYALAVKDLMNRLEIDCEFVTSDSMNHAWNIIRVNNNWYYMDVTWNDPIDDRLGNAGHLYLLKSYDSFQGEESHTASDYILTGNLEPSVASDTKYDNYFWDNIDSPFVYYDGSWYGNNQNNITKYTGNDTALVEQSVIYQLTDTWKVWDGTGIWTGCYSGCSLLGSRLYYAAPQSIRSIDLSSAPLSGTLEYELTDEEKAEGYIYGFYMDKKGILHYGINQSPKGYAQRKTIRLKKGGPITKTDEKNYVYSAGSRGSVSLDIAALFADEDMGACEYSAAAEDAARMLSDVSVSEAGILSYTVGTADTFENEKTAVITVMVKSENYENSSYQLTVKLTDKLQVKPVNGQVTLKSSQLVYGEPLSVLAFEEITFVDTENGKAVGGTLAFADPALKPAVGTTKAQWIFTPDDNLTYDILRGEASITVQRADTVITIDNNYPTDYIYTGEPVKEPENSQLGTNREASEGAQYQLQWYSGNETAAENLLETAPAETGDYILAVTVKQSPNYNSAVLNIPVEIQSYRDCPDASLSGTGRGTDGWYQGNVTIHPPEGHLISTDRTKWETALNADNREGIQEYSYYLKQKTGGYISEKKQLTVKIDTALPAGTVKAAGQTWDSLAENITFELYTNTEEPVEIQGDDEMSGMAAIEYYLTEQPYTENELDTLNSEWLPYEAERTTLTADRRNIIYVRLTDKAGNTAYLSTDGIVHDGTAPEVSLEVAGTVYSDTLKSTDAYHSSVVYTVNASDMGSGCRNIFYSLDQQSVRNFENGGTLQINTRGIHTLKITAEDHAGNRTEIEKTVRIYHQLPMEEKGTESVYDGQPIEAGTAGADILLTLPPEYKGDILCSYVPSADGSPASGLPVVAGTYTIDIHAPEDTQECFMPAHKTFTFIIKPKPETPSGQTLYAVKNQEYVNTFDVSQMLSKEAASEAVYSIASVTNSSIFSNGPELEGSILAFSIADVSDNACADVEIAFSSPNYKFENAVIHIEAADKIPVELTGITFPVTGTYNGMAYACSGTPVWKATADGQTVNVDSTILYEGINGTEYSSAQAPSNAGDYRVTISVGDTGQPYMGTESAVFSIAKKSVIVTAKDKSIPAGGQIPSLDDCREGTDYSVDGVLPSEPLGGDARLIYLDGDGLEITPDSSRAGIYRIGISGFESINYDITYILGRLIIEDESGGMPTGTPVPSRTPTPSGTPVPTGTPAPSDTPVPTQKPAKEPGKIPSAAPAVGSKLKDNKSKAVYQVTKAGISVSYTGTSNKKAASINVPSKVKINGITYKVTSIKRNAFRNNKKLKKIVIANNIVTIGNSAFQGCTALATVKINGNTVKIGKQAFYNCANLKKVVLKSKNLTAKKIGAKAFKNAGRKNYKAFVVQVPSGKAKAYRKILLKKGLSRKAVVK